MEWKWGFSLLLSFYPAGLNPVSRKKIGHFCPIVEKVLWFQKLGRFFFWQGPARGGLVPRSGDSRGAGAGLLAGRAPVAWRVLEAVDEVGAWSAERSVGVDVEGELFEASRANPGDEAELPRGQDDARSQSSSAEGACVSRVCHKSPPFLKTKHPTALHKERAGGEIKLRGHPFGSQPA